MSPMILFRFSMRDSARDGRKRYSETRSSENNREPTAGVRASTIINSRGKAMQGFSIVSNACMDIRSSCSFSFTMLISIIIIIMLSLLYMSKGGRMNSQCLCSDNSYTTDTAVLFLQKPQRPFHGNHWFHMGEYYLSSRNTIDSMLQEHFSTHGTPKHIKIISFDRKLSEPMTKVSFSFLVLSCLRFIESNEYSGHMGIESIEFFAPGTATVVHNKQTYKASHRSGAIGMTTLPGGAAVRFVETAMPILGYYTLRPIDERFVDNRAQKSGSGAISGNKFGRKRARTAGRSGRSTKLTSAVWGKLFSISSSKRSPSSCANACQYSTYVGGVGAVPVASTEWFADSQEADRLRRTAWSMCETSATSKSYDSHSANSTVVRLSDHVSDTASSDQQTLTLLVYQRDLTRRFTDLSLILEKIHAFAHTSVTSGKIRWDIQVLMHSELSSPCALINALRQADILLTAHGFQSTGAMFMKPGAVLVEIFPYKYHRSSYVPLTVLFGLHYRSVQNTAPSEGSGGALQSLLASLSTGAPSAQLLRVVSQGACMRDLKCRSYARSRDITMPQSHIDLVLQTMREVETTFLRSV